MIDNSVTAQAGVTGPENNAVPLICGLRIYRRRRTTVKFIYDSVLSVN